MTFLMVFAALLAAYIIRIAFQGIFHHKEFKQIFTKSVLFEEMLELAFGFCLNLFLALLITVLTDKTVLYSTFLMFTSTQIFFLIVKPVKFFVNWKHKEFNARKGILVGLGLALSILEAFVFNLNSYKSFGTQIDANLSSVVVANATQNVDEIKVQNNSMLTFELEEDAKTVRVDMKNVHNSTITVKVDYKLPEKDTWNTYASYGINGEDDRFDVLGIGERTKGESIRLTFTFATNRFDSTTTGVVVGLRLNARLPFDPSFARYAFLLVSVSLVAYASKFAHKLKEKDASKVPYLVFGGIFLVLFTTAIIIVSTNLEAFSMEYPLTRAQMDARSTDIFIMLFDSIKKGQANLDITVSPGLLACKEPWIPANRNFYYLWDHAYYNGNYYCYYGMLPVLLISFPFYWCTGRVINAFGLEIFGMALLVPAFLFVLYELYLIIRKKIDYKTYTILAIFSTIFALMFACVTFKDGTYHEAVYHTPDIYGLAMLDFFLGFVFLSKRTDKFRPLFLGLGGLSFVFIVLSRPSLIFIILIALPFLFAMLFQKERTWKRKIVDFSPMVVILVIGAIFVCYYNYIRFGSITEFGQSYQLTVADERNLAYSADKIAPSILHYFFHTPIYTNQFPYIQAPVTKYAFDNCPYVQDFYGLALVPVFWFAFLLPFFGHRKQDRSVQWFCYLFPILLFWMAFTSYSKAGVCARYMIEIYHITTIGSFAGILILGNRLATSQSNPEPGVISKTYVLSLFAILTVSAFITFNLSFDPFDGMSVGDAGGLLLEIRKMFGMTNLKP